MKEEIAQLLKKGYSRDYAIEQVAEKCFLRKETVERIYWGEYDRRRERKAEKQEAARRDLLPPSSINARQVAGPS